MVFENLDIMKLLIVLVILSAMGIVPKIECADIGEESDSSLESSSFNGSSASLETNLFGPWIVPTINPYNNELRFSLLNVDYDFERNAFEYYKDDPENLEILDKLKKIGQSEDAHYILQQLAFNFTLPSTSSCSLENYERSKLKFDNLMHQSIIRGLSKLKPVFPGIKTIRISPYFIIINNGVFADEECLSQFEYDDLPSTDTYQQRGETQRLVPNLEALLDDICRLFAAQGRHPRAPQLYELHVLLSSERGKKTIGDESFTEVLDFLLGASEVRRLFVNNSLVLAKFPYFPATFNLLKSAIIGNCGSNISHLELWDSECWSDRFCPLLSERGLGKVLSDFEKKGSVPNCIDSVTLKVIKLRSDYEKALLQKLTGPETTLTSFVVNYSAGSSFVYHGVYPFVDSKLSYLAFSSRFGARIIFAPLKNAPLFTPKPERTYVHERNRLGGLYDIIDRSSYNVDATKEKNLCKAKKNFGVYLDLGHWLVAARFNAASFRWNVHSYSALTVRTEFFGYIPVSGSSSSSFNHYNFITDMLSADDGTSCLLNDPYGPHPKRNRESFCNLNSLQIMGSNQFELSQRTLTHYSCPFESPSKKLYRIENLSIRNLTLSSETINRLSAFLIKGRLRVLTLDVSASFESFRRSSSKYQEYRWTTERDIKHFLAALSTHSRPLKLNIVCNKGSGKHLYKAIVSKASSFVSLAFYSESISLEEPIFPTDSYNIM